MVGNLTIVNTGNPMNLGNAYVGGNVDFDSGGRQTTAPVLVVDGTVNVVSGNLVGTSAVPCMLLMTNSTNTPETFLANGGTTFTGVVTNLTGGTTTLNNGDVYTGSIFSAGTVTMLGNAQVNFQQQRRRVVDDPDDESRGAADRHVAAAQSERQLSRADVT